MEENKIFSPQLGNILSKYPLLLETNNQFGTRRMACTYQWGDQSCGWGFVRSEDLISMIRPVVVVGSTTTPCQFQTWRCSARLDPSTDSSQDCSLRLLSVFYQYDACQVQAKTTTNKDRLFRSLFFTFFFLGISMNLIILLDYSNA